MEYNMRGNRTYKLRKVNRAMYFKKNPLYDHLQYRKHYVDDRPRKELADYEGQIVEFSGEVKVLYKDQTADKPILLENLVLKGVYIEHTWVHLHKEDVPKTRFGCKDTRWYFTGEVFRYISRGQTKFGIRKVRLVK